MRDRQEVCETKRETNKEILEQNTAERTPPPPPPQRQEETETDGEMVRGRQMHKERKTDKERQNDE